MQAYQYEQISADPDKPLADGIRALDTTDMERYGAVTLVLISKWLKMHVNLRKQHWISGHSGTLTLASPQSQ